MKLQRAHVLQGAKFKIKLQSCIEQLPRERRDGSVDNKTLETHALRVASDGFIPSVHL